ncbi:uncharacterized protein [Clytia hemisphaerica]|uniref:SAM domain-containing protein n=1 Tax=Clytia hemisphaerica TaxID=252671 RepID=A0A7M5WTI7_9CNID
MTSRSESLKKVSSYLEQLGLDNLIQIFMAEKFDETAITNAGDDVLRELGMEAVGDRIRIRAMCKQSQITDLANKKTQLKKLLTTGASSRKKEHKTRILYVSWKHFDKKQKKYQLVKSRKGGGLVKLTFLPSDDKNTIHNAIVKHFVDNQKGVLDDNKDAYFFNLMNEKEDPITDILEFPDGAREQFTFNGYLAISKQTRPKMFLYSKQKSSQQRILSHYTFSKDEDSDDESDDENETDNASFSRGNSSSPFNHIPSSHSTPNPVEGSHLIGSSEERRQINLEIERAYQASLASDRGRDRDGESTEGDKNLTQE